jgi:hypothetical protein
MSVTILWTEIVLATQGSKTFRKCLMSGIEYRQSLQAPELNTEAMFRMDTISPFKQGAY